jgi:DNA-binding response OmpR family regulator
MKGRILIVEDEPAIQLALSGLLRRDGHTVTTASSGKEAFAKLEAEALDLVLTDLSLGDGVTGMDVLRHAKRQRSGAAVVMITAFGSEHVAEEAVRAGADGYVPKPFNNHEIRAEVDRVLSARRGRS